VIFLLVLLNGQQVEATPLHQPAAARTPIMHQDCEADHLLWLKEGGNETRDFYTDWMGAMSIRSSSVLAWAFEAGKDVSGYRAFRAGSR
jgi:hypothetical protein